MVLQQESTFSPRWCTLATIFHPEVVNLPCWEIKLRRWWLWPLSYLQTNVSRNVCPYYLTLAFHQRMRSQMFCLFSKLLRHLYQNQLMFHLLTLRLRYGHGACLRFKISLLELIQSHITLASSEPIYVGMTWITRQFYHRETNASI